MTESLASGHVRDYPPDGDYYVLDGENRIVHASEGSGWMRHFLGHVFCECLPYAGVVFRPRFEEARREAREVEFKAFYAGALSRIRVVPSGSDLTVFVTHLERLNFRTLGTLTESLRQIEAVLADQASEQLDPRAHGSLRALP